jgi:hypothetical protein
MRHVFLVLCSIALLPFMGLAQSAADSVYWCADRPLQWADFQGTAEPIPIFGARTFTSLKYKLQDNDTGCNVKVLCVFLKKVSWQQPQHATSYALRHEQVHFDISELFARKLRQAYSYYHYNKETVQEDVADIFMTICAEKTAFNRQYDEETCHSLNKDKQREWRDKVTAMLDELKEYQRN